MKTIRLRTSKRALYESLRRLPKELAGKRTESDMNKVFLNHLAHNLFLKVQESFDDKSEGKADEFGKRWKPLPPSTIAARPISNEEYRQTATRQGERGILTVFENKIWKGVFWNTYKRLRVELDEPRAKAAAGQTAWAVVKALGGKTKLAVFGRRRVKILRNTDRLYHSLTAGTLSGNRYYPPKEQVFELEQGELTLGTKVPYAGHVSRLRPVLPTAADVSRAGWLKEAIRASLKGVTSTLAQFLIDQGSTFRYRQPRRLSTKSYKQRRMR